jgi:S-adenosylmethionine-diacylglycerol 3-amino-3-carboxypropyl transferase
VSPAILARWRYDAAASRAGTAADRSAIYGGFHVWRRAA